MFSDSVFHLDECESPDMKNSNDALFFRQTNAFTGDLRSPAVEINLAGESQSLQPNGPRESSANRRDSFSTLLAFWTALLLQSTGQ